MFYKKKKHSPGIKDLIVYPNMNSLCKYEGITKNTFMFERKIGLIVKSLYLKEKNVRKGGEFDKYSNGYIRLTDIVLIEGWFSSLKRKRNARPKGDDGTSEVFIREEYTREGSGGSKSVTYY